MRRTNAVTILSSLKVYSLTNFPHYLHPNNTLILNGNDRGEDDELFTPSLGVQSSYPVKFHLPTDVNSTVEQNIVLKLVQQKNQYLNDITKITGNYKRSSKTRSNEIKNQLKVCAKRINLVHYSLESGGGKKSKGNVYSMHLNNLMELTTKDPDPYFFGSYNWYYTGGTLETASIYDVDFLFYATGEKLNIFSKIFTTCLICDFPNFNQMLT